MTTFVELQHLLTTFVQLDLLLLQINTLNTCYGVNSLQIQQQITMYNSDVQHVLVE